MSGRKPLPVFHYDTEENNFKYLGKFESRAEVFKMYSGGKKGRLFEEGYEYKKLSDGTYVTKERIGREGLRKIIRLTEDPTIYKRKNDQEIEIYNYAGELVGVVANVRILESIRNSAFGTVQHSLFTDGKDSPHFNNLSYKYKRK